MKDYKSPNDLLNYMVFKGIVIVNKDETLNKLRKYSYYSIINSYKDVFKDSLYNYKQGVTFDEIYALYEFDKNIRSIFLKFILEIETIIKSLVAEVIASKYGVQDYLVLENFDDKVNTSKIEESIDKIKEEIDKQNGKHEAVTHYINEYGFVPPFVLTKILTLGELSRLYTMLKQVDRQSISKEFKISDKLLKQIMKNMTMIRNICAHNDRLFSFHSKFLITFKDIDKKYINRVNSTNVYMIKESMKVLLDGNKSKEFEQLINMEIENLKNNINSINIDIILYLMGFPSE